MPRALVLKAIFSRLVMIVFIFVSVKQKTITFGKRILVKLKQHYSFDVRALALMRIGICIILFIDLAIRALSIKAFFTDEGILPLEILKNYNWNPYYFSFHTISGDLWFQALLFIMNAVSIILLLVGYRARLFTFICWVFLVSLHNRNPFILQGGDELLRILLFWAIFLPWGERYSLQKTSYYKNTYFSFANVGYLLLVASVYFFSALLKNSSEWYGDFTAIYYALSLEQMRLPIGTFIYQFPLLLKVLTAIVICTEFLAPIALVIPFFSKKIRLIGIIAIVLLQLGIGSTMYVGLFFIIGIVSLIGFLPSSLIDWFEKKQYKNKVFFVPQKKYKNNVITLFNGIKNGFIVITILYCLILNVGNVKWFPYSLNPSLIKYGSVFRLEQNWGMFSPTVLKDDGWYVYCGYTKNGNYIDIKHDLEFVSYAKPKNIVEEYESDRWRKYGENYTFNTNNHIRPLYCKYLIKKWNNEHPNKQLVDLSIFYMKETSLPNYKTKPIEKVVVCNCQE